MKTLVGIFLVAASFYDANGDGAVLPSYVKRCHRDQEFEKCVKEQLEISLPIFTKGVPELGVPSIDPLKLDDIIVKGNGLDLSLKEAQLHGISTAKVQSLRINIDEEKFTLSFIANMSATGKYNIDGRVLILPVQGSGDSIIRVDNAKVEISSKMLHTKSATGEHFKLVSPNYKYDIERTTFRFENLFNGNKELSDATHRFANDNWKQLMDDLAPPVIKQIVRSGIKAINKFFNKLTITQLIEGYKSPNQ